jgi:uncharacterized protein (DUF305 family)
MKHSLCCRLAALAAVALIVACGDDGMTMGDVAPEQLVIDGNYSDERFIDMMAAHHQMAIDMARVEQQKGTRQELKTIAAGVIDAQQKEIEEFKSLKQAHFGSSDVPTQMNHAEMQNGGMMMPEEMGQQPDVDKAFIDSMLPHHAGAIEMATVALQRGGIAEIRTMARNIIDMQAEEIGQLGDYRKAWYGTQP